MRRLGEEAGPRQGKGPGADASCDAAPRRDRVEEGSDKDGTITCQYQVYREMTHAEAWALCRKKYGATQAFVQKKKGGWWCRYYGRY
jgi:hypothetical protein